VSLASQHDKLADAVPAETNRPGYLGPTSYEAILPKDEASSLRHREASMESNSSNQDLSHQHVLPKSIRTQMASDILKSLRHYNIIQESIEWYHDNSHAAFIPMPLDLDLINALRPVVQRYNLEHSVPDHRLVAMVLENSSRPLEISSTLRARDFHKICSGDNIRFETVGFLLSTASRALCFGSCDNLFSEKPDLKSRLMDELLRASTACVILCSMISPVHDVTIWMLFSNFFFTVMVCGISGTVDSYHNHVNITC
jgi:hypothetical protein